MASILSPTDQNLERGAHGDGLVVVTGAAGFIGSTLCEALLAGGWRVRGIDAFTASYDPGTKMANMARLLDNPRFDLVEADLSTAELTPLLDDATAIAHLAGEAGVSTSWGEQFDLYVQRNVLATQRLLHAASSTSVGRFVYSSSSSIYGNITNGPVPEAAVPRPASPYGVTKLAAEHLVSAYAEQGFPAVTLRYFSVYGPRQRPDMALHRFIEAALNGEPLTVFGDGGQVRDFTYVDDVVAATVAALTADLEAGAVLNIAGGQPVQIADVVALLGRLLDLEELGTHHEPERPGDVARTNGSVAAARERLGWTPRTEMAVGVSNQIQWHLANRRVTGQRVGVEATSSARVELGRSRLLIYSQDGLGLGHLRRAGSLAAEFLKGNAGGTVLTISDSPLGTFVRETANHDFLKLPSIVKTGPGDWHSLALGLSFPEVVGLRSRVIAEAAAAFRPDVLLVDHMPHGAMGELIPTLDMLRDGSTQIVLGMRDIIDAPQVVRQRWQSEGALDALARYYDRVLVYGSREIFDVAEEYGWPAELAELIRYCGYACTPEPPAHPKRVRSRRLGKDPARKLIVAMAGGGADAYPLMSALLDAYPKIVARRPSVLVLVTGPFMPDALRRDLRARSEGMPVRVRSTVRDPLSYLAAADLVVAMAGYNTTTEIMRVGTPALLVPRCGPSSEQRMRAQRFADRGWVSQLDPDELNPSSLASAVLDALVDRKSAPPRPPDLGGIGCAVEHLHAATLASYVRSFTESSGLALASSQRLPA